MRSMNEYGRDCRSLFELVVATYYCGIGKEVKSFVGIILLSDWVKRLGRLAGVTPAKHVGPTFEAAFRKGNGRRLNQTRGFSPGLLGVWRFCSMTAGHYREQVSDKERTAWKPSQGRIPAQGNARAVGPGDSPIFVECATKAKWCRNVRNLYRRSAQVNTL